MMSGGMVRIAQNSQKTFAKVQGMIDNTKKKNDTLSQSFGELSKRIKDAERTINSSTSVSHIRAARRELDALYRMQRRHPGNMPSVGGASSSGMFGGLLGKAAGFIAPMAIAGSLLGGANQAANAATNYEATNKTFEVLTGNKAKGKALSGELNKLQQDTILGPEVFKSAQTLLGFGIAADKIIPSIKMLGDVSMGDKERFDSLTLAFSQMTAAGRLQGQDLLQFVNAGFNPLGVMAEKTGKSMLQLKTDMEKGEISSKMVTDAFVAATSKGGKFNDMMNQMAETTKGKLAMLEGQTQANMIAIGQHLKPAKEFLAAFKYGLIELITPHQRLQDSIITEKTSINTLVGAITNVNTSNDVRLALLNKLKNSYPELFGAIDTEKIKNSELLSTLDNINAAYEKRIGLATKQNSVNELKESAEGQFKLLVTATQFAEAHPEQKQLKGQIAIQKKMYENTLSDLARANEVNDAAKNLNRIKDVIAFVDDPTKMATAFKGRDADKNQFLNYVNTFKNKGFASGYNSTTIDTVEALMKGKVTASNIATAAGSTGGSSSGKEGKGSVASGITGGGPRVININGVKFAEKIEIHATTIQGGIDQLEDKFEESFLRILHSGAAVQ